MRKLIPLLLIMIFTPLKESKAYPQFIGHGYPSCLNCHYNPMGNGPLTDYGRAVGATGIASRMFYPSSWSEEKIGDSSGFLFRKPKQEVARTQLNYRGLQMVQAFGTSNAKSSWINMQGSGQLILKFLNDDRLIMVGEIGYNPPSPQARAANQNQKILRSREHYVGYRFNPEFGVYAGFMDKAYGIRVAEHIALSRVYTDNTQNDQTHGVMIHGLAGGFEGALHAFFGSMFQSADIRQKGVSLQLEREVNNDHRIGFSFLNSKNDYIGVTSYGAHSRISLNDGSALMFEFGQNHRNAKSGSGSRISRYGLLQTFSKATQGLYLIANIDYGKTDLSQESSVLRWGPGIQFFPIQKVELRADLYNSRVFNENSTSLDSWMLLLQTHIWL
ncbi:MAG: hypothetical protein KGP28_05075 [Bdellovibrionales bacterium]|nr:hypothetical protein [Bdellovibrionales bacterium]